MNNEMQSSGKIFQIYGRTAYDEPLAFVREIVARESVQKETLAALAEADWVELIAIPVEKLLFVIGGNVHGRE